MQYSSDSEYPNQTLSWSKSIGDSHEQKLKLKYHYKTLGNFTLAICDNSRFAIIHPKMDWLYCNLKNLNDIYANNSTISDAGKTIGEVDFIQEKGNCKQVKFFYHIRNSIRYLLQQILNKDNPYNIYKDYEYNQC